MNRLPGHFVSNELGRPVVKLCAGVGDSIRLKLEIAVRVQRLIVANYDAHAPHFVAARVIPHAATGKPFLSQEPDNPLSEDVIVVEVEIVIPAIEAAYGRDHPTAATYRKNLEAL